MNEIETQEEIEAILKVLNQAKQYSGLGPNDPSVIALEEIMLAKVAALKAVRLQSVTLADAVATHAGNEQAPHPEFLPLLFATDEEPSDETPQPGQSKTPSSLS